MNDPRPVAIAIAVSLVLAAASASEPSTQGTAPDPPIPTVASPLPGYLPDPLDGSGRVNEDGAWVFSAGGISMRLSAVDEDGRWAWLERESGAMADPFGARGAGEPAYVSLLIELRNDSAGVVSFNPERIWLTAGGADIQRPLDLATMQSAYRMHDREMPPAYEKAGAALLQGDTLVRSGEHRVGLLVFRALEGRPDGFRVEIPLTTGDGDVVDFTASWLEESRLRKKLAREDKRRAKRDKKRAKQRGE